MLLSDLCVYLQFYKRTANQKLLVLVTRPPAKAIKLFWEKEKFERKPDRQRQNNNNNISWNYMTTIYTTSIIIAVGF
jgi:hypothetical protein